MIDQLVRAADIELVGGRAVELLALALDVQRITRGGVGLKKLFGRGAGDQQLAELAQDDRPAKQRQQQQHDHGDLAFGGGVLDGVNRRVG